MDIKKTLRELAEPEYKAFSSRLLPKGTNLLGVRLPMLKKIARDALRQDGLSFLQQADYEIFEEKLVCGYMLSYPDMPLFERLRLIKEFVPKIDNWSVCDSFCAAFRFREEQKAEVFRFLQPYLASINEYEARYGLVMLLNHFIDSEYINEVIDAVKQVKAESYYAQMAAAWTMSVCLVRFPEQTLDVLEKKTLSPFIHNKAIKKACESLRIDAETKKYIKTLK